MNTLETAYKILYSLERKDKPRYMGQIISPKALDVSEDEWIQVLQLLLDEGYIGGVTIKENIIGGYNVDVGNAHITLAGAEYLRDNSAFAKFRDVATDVISVAANVVSVAKSIK